MAPTTFNDLLPELKDIIFKHFKGKKFLNLSLVCQAWYDHIASSNMCMNRIEIRMKGQYKEMSMETKDLLKYSKRHYQHLYAKSCSNQIDKLIDIVSGPGHAWRIDRFDDLNFITNEDYENILTGIEKTIQEIKFDKIGIHLPTSRSTNYHFPNLTS